MAGFAQLSPPYGATGAARFRRLLRVRAVRAADDNQQQSQLEQTRENPLPQPFRLDKEVPDPAITPQDPDAILFIISSHDGVLARAVVSAEPLNWQAVERQPYACRRWA